MKNYLYYSLLLREEQENNLFGVLDETLTKLAVGDANKD